MIQKHRINTNIGRDQRVNVEINQNFDLMEILSLKFTQKDIFASGGCSEYGVVVGRVSANNGYGVPNAKVSIFIPQDSLDANDPVISKLYPYQEINDHNEDGYRYNLLAERQQHSGHAATGTFPDQQDILTREEVLEVFETYYKYTVKTNSAGDFMIWGVPIGIQTVHVDMDLSDMGCFSLRPFDFIKQGYGVEEFERYYKFKSSSDIDGLPQIVTFDRSIEVYPLWGNDDLCGIGITRTDFDLSDKGIKIEPISLILLSSITDDNSDAVRRTGRIRPNTGFKCNLQTTGGKIECVRQTGKTVYGSDGVTKYPELEFFNVPEVIDENGIAMAAFPMNNEYVYTNVFGEEEITNDANKGVPTTAIARFRFSLDFSNSKIATAKYLVPNIREFNPNTSGLHDRDEYSEAMISSYMFSDVFEDYINPPTPEGVTLNTNDYFPIQKNHKKALMLGTLRGDGIPEDYFYKFIYGKVYTVSSFQGTHYETIRRDAFLGIKQIRPTVGEDCASKTNYIPTNFAYRNRTNFSLLLSQVSLFMEYIIGTILIKFAEILGSFLWSTGVTLYDLKIGSWRPLRKVGNQFKDMAYRTQDRYTKILPLTIYPDCEECTTDSDAYASDGSFSDNYCRVAELAMNVLVDNGYVYCVTSVSDFVDGAYKRLPTDISFLWNGGLGDSATINDRWNGIFPGEYAKESGGYECDVATSPDFTSLQTIATEKVDIVPPETEEAKYFAQIYPFRTDWEDEYSMTGGTISFGSNLIYITDKEGLPEYVNIKQGSPMGLTDRWFRKTYQEWLELTGMDLTNPEVYNWMVASENADKLQVILRLSNREFIKVEPTSGSTVDIETGCQKYDKTYKEDYTFGYIYGTGTTYGNTVTPWDPSGIPGSNWDTYDDAPGYREYGTSDPLDPPYTNLLSTIIGNSTTKRLPSKVDFSSIGLQVYDRKTKSGLTEFRDGVFTIIPVISGKSYSLGALQEWYRRKRIGLSFCGGVVNYSFVDNWLHGLLYFFKFDKRVKWDTEEDYDLSIRGTRYPRQLVFYHLLDKEFYYRSCPYRYDDTEEKFKFIGQELQNFFGETVGDTREILHPTTFYDVGVRDEFLHEICIDPRVDPNCSVVRDITTTSYQDPAGVVEYAINYRLDVSNGDFDIQDFFSGSNYGSAIKIFDGDITQLMSINCEAGIEEFNTDTPHYFMYNGEMMDPEDPNFETYFKQGSSFGPVPIDFKFDYNGSFIRSCLNYRLGDYSQVVPFYLWDKKGEGFGTVGGTSDDQSWDKSEIAHMKLQRLFSVSGATDYDLGTSTTDGHSNYLMANGEEEYLLRPMTIEHDVFWFYGSYEDALERFEAISYSQPPDITQNGAQNNGYIEGELWLEVLSGSLSDPQSGYLWAVVDRTWVKQTGVNGENYFDSFYETFIPQTILNYADNKQVLSTPFLFYFGLTPGKSALDMLIKYFGPKGAFGESDLRICPTFGNVTPSPSSTPAASLLPDPSAPAVSGVVSSPTPTPTPSPTPSSNSFATLWYYEVDWHLCDPSRTEQEPCTSTVADKWISSPYNNLVVGEYYYHGTYDINYLITASAKTYAEYLAAGGTEAVQYNGITGSLICVCRLVFDD